VFLHQTTLTAGKVIGSCTLIFCVLETKPDNEILGHLTTPFQLQKLHGFEW